MSQWRGTRPDAWYRLEGWNFLNPVEMDKEKGLGRSRLRREMSDLRKDIKELVGSPDQQWALTVKKLRFEEEDGQLRGNVTLIAHAQLNHV